MLRVIGGKYRTRKLDQPPFDITRPTTDRTKEAIFSMIQFEIKDSIILDLFSGSGSLAIEAISRGAMKAILLEKSIEAIKIINKNIKSLDITNAAVVHTNVLTYIDRLKGKKFDFIFIDPPYKEIDVYNETLNLIEKNQLLKNLGLIILEIQDFDKIIIPKSFVIQKQRKYGISTILLISNNI